MRGSKYQSTGSWDVVLPQRAETLERLRVELMALSPLQVLERGYSIAFDQNGRALRSLADLPRGMKFELKLHDGAIMAESEGRKE